MQINSILMVESNIQMTTDPSGNPTVMVPLAEWEKIQQELKEWSAYKELKAGLKTAFLEVEAIKKGELSRKTLEEFLAEFPDIQEVIVKIEEGADYDNILKEQNYQPVTYEKFRALADDIEWEHSLDEMLAVLD